MKKAFLLLVILFALTVSCRNDSVEEIKEIEEVYSSFKSENEKNNNKNGVQGKGSRLIDPSEITPPPGG